MGTTFSIYLPASKGAVDAPIAEDDFRVSEIRLRRCLAEALEHSPTQRDAGEDSCLIACPATMNCEMLEKSRRRSLLPKLAHLHVLMKLLECRIPIQNREHLPFLRIAVVDSGFQVSFSEALGPVAQSYPIQNADASKRPLVGGLSLL